MKKFYLFLSVMLLTLVSVGFTSCGDDNDEPKGSDLVGTWQLKAIDEDGGSYENLVQFTKNGVHQREVFLGTFHDVDHDDESQNCRSNSNQCHDPVRKEHNEHNADKLCTCMEQVADTLV